MFEIKMKMANNKSVISEYRNKNEGSKFRAT